MKLIVGDDVQVCKLHIGHDLPQQPHISLASSHICDISARGQSLARSRLRQMLPCCASKSTPLRIRFPGKTGASSLPVHEPPSRTASVTWDRAQLAASPRSSPAIEDHMTLIAVAV